MKESSLLIKTANHETEKWKTTLHLLQHENILQKNKLAEMLKNKNEKKNLLEQVEQYNNQFLQQDEIFKFLWNDLTELERLITIKPQRKDSGTMPLSYRRQKLKNEIENLQIHFEHLRTRFLNFETVFNRNRDKTC